MTLRQALRYVVAKERKEIEKALFESFTVAEVEEDKVTLKQGHMEVTLIRVNGEWEVR
jgi:hypothetical protein